MGANYKINKNLPLQWFHFVCHKKVFYSKKRRRNLELFLNINSSSIFNWMQWLNSMSLNFPCELNWCLIFALHSKLFFEQLCVIQNRFQLYLSIKWHSTHPLLLWIRNFTKLPSFQYLHSSPRRSNQFSSHKMCWFWPLHLRAYWGHDVLGCFLIRFCQIGKPSHTTHVCVYKALTQELIYVKMLLILDWCRYGQSNEPKGPCRADGLERDWVPLGTPELLAAAFSLFSRKHNSFPSTVPLISRGVYRSDSVEMDLTCLPKRGA